MDASIGTLIGAAPQWLRHLGLSCRTRMSTRTTLHIGFHCTCRFANQPTPFLILRYRYSPDAPPACHSISRDHRPGGVRGAVPAVVAAALPRRHRPPAGTRLVVADQPGVGGGLQRAVRGVYADCRGVLAGGDQPCRVWLGLRAGVGSGGAAPDPLRTHHAGPVLPAQPVAGARADRLGPGANRRRSGAGLAQYLARRAMAGGRLAQPRQPAGRGRCVAGLRVGVCHLLWWRWRSARLRGSVYWR